MATLEAINIKKEAELDRIEQLYKRITGRDVTPMRRVHKDRDLLHLEHLSTIADWMEHMKPVDNGSVDNDTLTQARDMVASGSWTKTELQNLLLGVDDGDVDSE